MNQSTPTVGAIKEVADHFDPSAWRKQLWRAAQDLMMIAAGLVAVGGDADDEWEASRRIIDLCRDRGPMVRMLAHAAAASEPEPAPDGEPEHAHAHDHEPYEPAIAERPALEFTLNSPELDAMSKDLAAIARALSGPRSERIRRAVDTSRSVEADE